MNASAYVGRLWTPAYTCWAMVCEVQLREFGRTMPPLDIGGQPPGQQEHVLQQMIGRGRPWQPTQRPQQGDILVCRSVEGPHVGVMVDARRVLHNRGSLRQPGSVKVDRLVDMTTAGYSRLQFYTCPA